jgi:hypothetical protein
MLIEDFLPVGIESLPLFSGAGYSGDTDAVVLATVCLIAAVEIAFQNHEKMILWRWIEGREFR